MEQFESGGAVVSEREWRDGDIVIDPDGTEWTVFVRGGTWCLVTHNATKMTDLIENLLARGWRLKEATDE